MTTPKHHADLINSLDKYLRRIPQPREYHALLADIGRYHPELFRDSIAEAAGAEESGTTLPPQARNRSTIIKIYNRKTKEMAALYPLLMSVEGALRGQLASAMYRMFGVDKWWISYCAAIASGNEVTTVTAVNGFNVPGTKFSRTIGKIIATINAKERQNAATLSCGFEFLSGASFGQLRYVAEASWSNIMPLFRGRRGGPAQIVKADFMDLTKVILDLRNDLYHHRPISNQQSCVDACERLLDHFDHHMGAFDYALSQVVYVRPLFNIAQHARHDIINDA
jgi:hypothetical protein